MNSSVSLLDAGYAAARWGGYLAIFLLLGAASYAPFLLRGRGALGAIHPEVAEGLSRRAARLGLAAAAVLLLLVLLRFYLQARTLADPDEGISFDFLRAVFDSRWGHGWRRQAILACLALPAFAAAGKGFGWGWLGAMVTSLGLGSTAGMTGHAATSAAGRGGLLLDAVHVTAGGLWLGGLAVMFWAGIPACRAAARPGAVRAMVAEFSRRAQVLAPLTLAVGVWMSARYLGWSWPLRLTKSGYTLVLGGKILVFLMVGALGAYNWRVTQPGLTREGGDARLRRFSALELWFGVVLLGITAVLVAMPLPEGSM